MKDLHNLPKDIFQLFETKHSVSDERLEELKETLGQVVKESLETSGESRKFELRMSNIGTPDRKLWLDAHDDEDYGIHSGQTYFKFLYGHILEAIVLFLAKEAGHSVEGEQREIEIQGVKGHMDAIIDGVTTDAKSASPYAFTKFINGDILSNDSFGYRHQLKGYYEEAGTESSEVAWLLINKVTGEIAIVSYDAMELPSATDRITRAQEVLKLDEAPEERCYTETTDKMGNSVMPKVCTFCKHKSKCWDYRIFKYSTGYVYLTDIVKKPRVQEIINE